MARSLLSGMVSAVTSAYNSPFVMFEGAFSASTLRLWTGHGDVTWNSQTWLGNGWFQGIEGGEEATEVEAMDMTVVLSGVPSSLVSLVLGSQVQGATGSIYIGFLGIDKAIIPNPYLWWQGQYSHAEIEEEATETTIKLYYDGPLIDMDRPNEGRWTHEFQQRLFPGDRGFEYVVATANWSGNWGQGKKNPTRPKPPKGQGKGKQRR